jgi:transcriptional regulator with XRE-family HTH domain
MLLFGSYLDDLMRSRGKTGEWLAKHLGISVDYIQIILEGRMTPGERRIKKVEKALELSEQESGLLWTFYRAAETGILEVEEEESNQSSDISLSCAVQEEILPDCEGKYDLVSPEEIADLKIDKGWRIPVVRRNQNGDRDDLEDELGDFIQTPVSSANSGIIMHLGPPKNETVTIAVAKRPFFETRANGKAVDVTVLPMPRLLRDKKEVEIHRFSNCVLYDRCLNEAIKKRWISFSCKNCFLFGKDEFIDPDLIESAWESNTDYNPFLMLIAGKVE